MVAATGGDVAHFQDARHFASWFGLTPKEHSSGSSRHLGRISKRGDRYLRMLLTHGARYRALSRYPHEPKNTSLKFRARPLAKAL
jgi:transposase